MTKSKGIGKGRWGPREPRSDVEIEQSKENRKLWEKDWKLEYFQHKPEKRLIWAARKRAKSKGLEFNLDIEDIVIPAVCPYLGIELVPHVPRGTQRAQCMSLDRINNSKGYIKGNVEVISHLANSMKNCATKEQLIAFANEILRRG